jgi:hypothetical protein
VPTIDAAHLTEAQRRAYMLADNRMALDAGWDNDLLKIELQDLGDAGFDLTLTGFDLGELNSIFLEPSMETPDSSSKEIGPDAYAMGHKCPKCGFEYDE